MTRRLAYAILLIVWATLIAGGLVAYLTTRSLLLADLDAMLIRRARALPELSGHMESAQLEDTSGDRYVVSHVPGQTQARVVEGPALTPPPKVLHAAMATLGDGQKVRTLTLRFTPRTAGEDAVVVYSGSAERFDRVLNRLAAALAVFGLAAGALAAAVAAGVSRAALRPLCITADAIGAIDERRLDRRIDASALPVELHPVAYRLNEMLERLQIAFAQHKQFLADASHELRTPVAAMITTLEVALRRPRPAADLMPIMQTCLTDARMLRQIVQALLEHARSETMDLQHPRIEVFDGAEVLNDCAAIAECLALENDVTVRRTLPGELQLLSQPPRLRGIVMNLLGNAVEYNRPGGRVELVAEIEGADLKLCVIDTGRGIAAEHLAKVFQPFYRVQPPVSSQRCDDEPTHMGLGLYLVDSHVKALGGECRIDSIEGVGTTVHVRLPYTVVVTGIARQTTGELAAVSA